MGYLPDTDVIKAELARQEAIKEKYKDRYDLIGKPRPKGEQWFDEWPIPPGIDEADKKLAEEFAETIGRMNGDGHCSAVHRNHLFKMMCTLIVSLRAQNR